jgi:hypothetical protein
VSRRIEKEPSAVMSVAKVGLRLAWVAIALVSASAAHAQPRDALDVTMTLLPEHATGPEEITRRIELPPAVAQRAVGDQAEPVKNGEREPPGRATAEEVRERGRAVGQQAAERAREDRENAGRGNSGNGSAGGGNGNGNPGGGNGNGNAGGANGNGNPGGGNGNGNAGGGNGNGNPGGGNGNNGNGNGNNGRP